MKIYIFLATIIAALFVFVVREYKEVAELENENAQIKQANAELNATLSEVILQNERDRQILQEKHEFDLQNALKTQKALNYVKKSDDSNASQLFNDTILLLQ
jgi:predicted Holliday junction resolvase-like endonuclease